jgi:molybdopterin-biosynthesis enzyme MoeA-like protein
MPAEESKQVQPAAFGLIVIGDEVLNGGRNDKHLAHFRAVLAQRGHTLAWHWLLPDDPEVLVSHLRFSLSRPNPVFVCGGIGATPDDYTRACAAKAANVSLDRHPDAEALIAGRFGADAYPIRIRMADLPSGCQLIPNPYNQVPGFSLNGHFFLPGFPEMAWKMSEWVLDEHFPYSGAHMRELAIKVVGVPESRLVPLMQGVSSRFPHLKLFSLPHIGEKPHILLGLRGREGLKQALTDLCAELDLEGIAWERLEDG